MIRSGLKNLAFVHQTVRTHKWGFKFRNIFVGTLHAVNSENFEEIIGRNDRSIPEYEMLVLAFCTHLTAAEWLNAMSPSQ